MIRDRAATAAFGAAHLVIPAVGVMFVSGVTYLNGLINADLFAGVLFWAFLAGAAGIAGSLGWLVAMIVLDRWGRR